jgi:hypothetical protein
LTSEFTPTFSGPVDVAALCAFVTAAQQNDQPRTVPAEVNSVTGANIDPTLHYAFSYSSNVTQISFFHPSYYPKDTALC